MRRYLKIIIIVGFLGYTEGGMAQARFKAAAFAGMNFSQIDGDRQQGFRKIGASLGLDGSIYLRPDFDISTQLLFNQKGSQPSSDNKSTQNLVLNYFSLDYSEVALLFNYHLFPNRNKTYYMRSFFVGLSYGRLLNSSISVTQNNQSLETFAAQVHSQFNSNDYSFIVGGSQLLTPKIGVSFRFSQSINNLYKNPNYIHSSNEIDFDALKPFFISTHVFYNFVSPNKTMGVKLKKQKAPKNPLEELY